MQRVASQFVVKLEGWSTRTAYCTVAAKVESQNIYKAIESKVVTTNPHKSFDRVLFSRCLMKCIS